MVQVRKKVEEIIPYIAKQSALQNLYPNDDGFEIYQLSESWYQKSLHDYTEFSIAQTPLQFETAVQSPDTVTILVPKKSALTMELIIRIMKRNGLDKTVFVEV